MRVNVPDKRGSESAFGQKLTCTYVLVFVSAWGFHVPVHALRDLKEVEVIHSSRCTTSLSLSLHLHSYEIIPANAHFVAVSD